MTAMLTSPRLALHPVAADEPVPLRDYQAECIDAIESRWAAGITRQIAQLPTGAGKCLGLGTPVLLYNGETVAVEDVRVGDMLMGPDSKPRRVLSTTRGRGEMFRIVPVRGQSWTCNDVHVLTLVETVSGNVIDIPLNEYLGKSRTFKHCHKQFAPERGVIFPKGSYLEIEPYFLGVWLGDGDHSLRGIAIAKPDIEIREYLERFAARRGMNFRVDGEDRCATYHLATDRGQPNPLLNQMRTLLGDSSSIPHRYLTAETSDRRALLAGLIDTDGYASKGTVEITQKRPGLARDIAFLARSLGFRVMESIKVVNDLPYCRLSISGDFSHIPVRIERKAIGARAQKKVATRTGFSVEPIGEGDYAGFELDGDGRFLLGDFTVTHNTIVACHLAGRRRQPTVFMVHRDELADQTIAKFGQNFPSLSLALCKADAGRTARDLDADVVVASAQTIANPKRLAELVQAVGRGGLLISDECHHDSAATRTRAINELDPGLLVGLTATPMRADGKELGAIYEEIVYQMLTSELVARGDLARPIGVRIGTTTDISGVATRAGDDGKDFVIAQVAQVVNSPERNNLIVDGWEMHALKGGRTRTVAFCVDVAHSIDLRDAFRARGYRAETVTGETPKPERERIYRAFRNGECQVLTNCMVLTEGWDEPRADCALMCRPTQSQSLYIQMAGRVLRKWPGKSDALIIDFVDISQQHGLQTIVTLAHDDEETEAPAPGQPQKLVGEQDRKDNEQFDLFAVAGERVEKRALIRRGAERMGDLLTSSKFQWAVSETGKFITSLGDARYIAIVPVGSGFVPVHMWAPRDAAAGYEVLFARPVDPETAMGVASQVIEPSALVDRNANWRKRPATDKQIGLAQRMNVRGLRNGMTAGEVGDLLTLAMFEKSYRRAGLHQLERELEGKAS